MQTAQATTLSRVQNCNWLTGQSNQNRNAGTGWQHWRPQFAKQKKLTKPRAPTRTRKRIVWLLLFTAPSPPPTPKGIITFSPFYAFALCCTFFYYECVCVGAPPIWVHTSLSTNCCHTIYSYSRCFFFVVRKNMILNKFKMHLLMCARCILCILCFARPAGRQTAPRGRKKLPQTTTESDRGANPRRGPVA